MLHHNKDWVSTNWNMLLIAEKNKKDEAQPLTQPDLITSSLSYRSHPDSDRFTLVELILRHHSVVKETVPDG